MGDLVIISLPWCHVTGDIQCHSRLVAGHHFFYHNNRNFFRCRITWGTRWLKPVFDRSHGGLFMAVLTSICSWKERKYGYFVSFQSSSSSWGRCPYRSCLPSCWFQLEFNGEQNNIKTFILGLLGLKLWEFVWLHVMLNQYTGDCGVKGLILTPTYFF